MTPNYGYDSSGLRAWKQVSGSTTYFLYDGTNPVCKLDGSGAVTATNTWGGNLLSRNAGGTSIFYTFDPSGNVAQRLDAGANVLGAYAFDAFGLRTGTDATTDPYAGFGGGWGYYADAETGLSLLGHRYYDTGTGRFVTRDPIGYAGGSNLYSYTENNPINRADPQGFASKFYAPGHVVNQSSFPIPIIFDGPSVPGETDPQYIVNLPPGYESEPGQDIDEIQHNGGRWEHIPAYDRATVTNCTDKHTYLVDVSHYNLVWWWKKGGPQLTAGNQPEYGIHPAPLTPQQAQDMGFIRPIQTLKDRVGSAVKQIGNTIWKGFITPILPNF